MRRGGARVTRKSLDAADQREKCRVLIAMRFVRKHPRVPLHCAAMLTPRGGVAIVGDVTDLSARGAAVVVASSVTPKATLALLLDPEGLPELARALPSFQGHVVSSRRTPEGQFRLGVRFQPLSPATTLRLGALLDALVSEAMTPRIDGERISDDGSGLRMGGSPEGRERLFQLAVERLSRGEHALAREAAIFALKGDTMNVHYRALVHRVNAEEAVAAGTPEKAKREVTIAASLLPDDEDLKALKALVDGSGRPAKGFFAKLIGKK